MSLSNKGSPITVVNHNNQAKLTERVAADLEDLCKKTCRYIQER